MYFLIFITILYLSGARHIGQICHIVLAKDELHKEAGRTSRGFLPFSLLFYNGK
jgi:hypothetical protein